ncbi:hypothetical protein ASE90_07380 [Sphingomonas sp. Leaf67]|uniref:hypothetical protein n=1 Tax=Sphingomonas sp. Leaf67 TaxID=1736230 RepID=UPI000701385D|nr:hypothetical protein [Sphingomonas sp. Leaf67]KQN83753.1 hypothetical protein ASE90_07380 [Sphingomonas sp. Leaf67]
MSNDTLATVGNIAAFLLFGSVVILTLAFLQRTRFRPVMRAGSNRILRRLIRLAWIGVLASLAMIAGAFWSSL